jgi:hypothetical protein
MISRELLCQLKEIKYFGLWIQVMALNRVWFQAIMNMIMNIHLSLKVGTSCTSSASVIFSRRIALHGVR